MKKMSLKHKFLMLEILFLCVFSVILGSTPVSFQNLNSTNENFNIKTSVVSFPNATVISDGFGGVYWNDGESYDPVIAVDSNDTVHAIWEDGTDGVWGTDYEIMYATYTTASSWSNATVISDGFGGVYWNDGYSLNPQIAVDSNDVIHVVWYDGTDGVWGTDYEIMHANYTTASGWSNATVISDGFGGVYWNDGNSYNPAIAVDSTNAVHVAWYDYTDGIWGTGLDTEIMYVNYTTASGWSNATVISDGFGGVYWNDGNSFDAKFGIDGNDVINVVWEDGTDGPWGTDYEIMHTKFTTATGWSNATVISDGFGGVYWNDGDSRDPAIAINSTNGIHVVWDDTTVGIWGTDREIMYADYSSATSWSNATIISDGQNNIYWNDGSSNDPEIIVDSNDVIHVVWDDTTVGIWGTDTEIMYNEYTSIMGWSLPQVISDGFSNVYWNDQTSSSTVITASTDKVYIVWDDGTNGAWGIDNEIMFSSISIPAPPGTLALSSTAETPDDDGIFNLTWSDSARANTYSIYQSSGYINVFNGSVMLVEWYLTSNSISLSGYGNGTYYFIIEAVNEDGSTLSNNLMVEVAIPAEPPPPSGGIPGYDIFIVIFGVCGVTYLFIRRKLKKLK